MNVKIHTYTPTRTHKENFKVRPQCLEYENRKHNNSVLQDPDFGIKINDDIHIADVIFLLMILIRPHDSQMSRLDRSLFIRFDIDLFIPFVDYSTFYLNIIIIVYNVLC